MANQFCILKFNHTIVQRFAHLVDTGLYKGVYNYYYYYFSATAGAVPLKQVHAPLSSEGRMPAKNSCCCF